MRYLFDTQALVSYLEGDSKLPFDIREFIEDYDNQGYVSVITLAGACYLQRLQGGCLRILED